MGKCHHKLPFFNLTIGGPVDHHTVYALDVEAGRHLRSRIHRYGKRHCLAHGHDTFSFSTSVT
jgi:hypothetical protein